MYDELIRKLRELASIPAHCENVESCDGCSKEDICLSFTNERIIEVATQAADAIEELTRENKEIIFRANQLEAMNDATPLHNCTNCHYRTYPIDSNPCRNCFFQDGNLSGWTSAV